MLEKIDFAILDFIQDTFVCKFLTVINKIFTTMGKMGAVWILIAVIFFFFKKYRKYGFMILVGLGVGLVVGNLFLKNVIARPRPFEIKDIVLLIKEPGEFSFPSGHTLSSFISATIILFANKKLGIFSFVLATLIALSRLYFFVHYPSDILGGILLGVFIGIMVKQFFDIQLNNNKNKPL